jgi:hypothetical protein
MKRKRKPGTVPLNRIPVLDHAGNVRGHVGSRATSATAARFTGHHGAVLAKVKGRTSWMFPK